MAFRDIPFDFRCCDFYFVFSMFLILFVKPWAGHYLCPGGLGQEFLSRWQNVRLQLGRNKSSSGSWNQFQGRLLQDGQDRIGQDSHGDHHGSRLKHSWPWGNYLGPLKVEISLFLWADFQVHEKCHFCKTWSRLLGFASIAALIERLT